MKPSDLHKVWGSPDHSKLTPRQISIRLPILDSARISALCEMYPGKTKTQIISDLISTALDQAIEGLPSKKGKFLGPDPIEGHEISELSQDTGFDEQEIANMNDTRTVYEDIGPRGQFYKLTKKYLRELEKEANINEKIYYPPPIVYSDEVE